jgi:general secretion pathway protein C
MPVPQSNTGSIALPISISGIAHGLQRQAPLVLSALLLLLLGAGLAWQSVEWLRLLRSPPAAIESRRAAPPATPTLAQLAALFGPTPVTQGAPPATTLRLTLHGSFVNAAPQRSSAIIQRNGDKPQRFAIGSELESGVRLHAVYADHIEVERNGRLETLRFPQHGNLSNVPAAGSPPPDAALSAPFSDLQEEDLSLDQLRERLGELRQELEEPVEVPPPPIEQPTESD